MIAKAALPTYLLVTLKIAAPTPIGVAHSDFFLTIGTYPAFAGAPIAAYRSTLGSPGLRAF